MGGEWKERGQKKGGERQKWEEGSRGGEKVMGMDGKRNGKKGKGKEEEEQYVRRGRMIREKGETVQEVAERGIEREEEVEDQTRERGREVGIGRYGGGRSWVLGWSDTVHFLLSSKTGKYVAAYQLYFLKVQKYGSRACSFGSFYCQKIIGTRRKILNSNSG